MPQGSLGAQRQQWSEVRVAHQGRCNWQVTAQLVASLLQGLLCGRGQRAVKVQQLALFGE
jgi:hypothetical protein